MSSPRLITILAPAYKEAGNLPRLIEALGSMADAMAEAGEIYEWEFLIVNDGSSDDTVTVLKGLREKDSRVNYLNLSRNFGKEGALLAGMDYAKGDCVVIMDADMQHPVSAIPKMIREWEKGYDDVYGIRLSRGKESWLRRRL